MTMLPRKWLYGGAVISALLQSGILYAGIEQRAAILRSGHEVVLQTEPVDPRDLMRGDYVTLNYEISSVARKDIEGQPPNDARSVYVALKAGNGGVWHLSRASFAPFNDLSADEVMIRGTATYPVSETGPGTVRLRYGIERYYVPEGEGRAIEDSQRALRITAVVAINNAGKAVLKALRDDGRQLYEEPLY